MWFEPNTVQIPKRPEPLQTRIRWFHNQTGQTLFFLIATATSVVIIRSARRIIHEGNSGIEGEGVKVGVIVGVGDDVGFGEDKLGECEALAEIVMLCVLLQSLVCPVKK